MSGMLNGSDGQTSSMRVMCIASLIMSMVFGVLTLTQPGIEQGTGVTITFGFLVAAFAPKAVQKFAEEKVK